MHLELSAIYDTDGSRPELCTDGGHQMRHACDVYFFGQSRSTLVGSPEQAKGYIHATHIMTLTGVAPVGGEHVEWLLVSYGIKRGR